MLAARAGAANVVRALLKAKAAINLADYTGHTALNYAEDANQARVVQILRKAGAHG
jgi:ankyrin repeat protein